MAKHPYSSEVSSAELLEAHSLLWSCSIGNVKSMSLKCAIELGIPDTIHNHGQPMSLSKLIASLQIHPSKAQYIYRLMRILVHTRIFTIQTIEKNENQEEEYYYSLTLASGLLLKEGALKTEAFFLVQSMPKVMDTGHFLSGWFRNDDATVFETSDGRTFWDCLSQEPRLSHLFNDGMSGDSHLIAEVALKERRELFEGLNSLVDVGGGTGTMAKAIAKTFPHISCTVFDLPHVVADLKGSGNLNFVGGDLFSDPIPPADAILLKFILHDWRDEDSLTILKKCREAVSVDGKKGKVIIIDIVIDNQKIDNKELTEIQLSLDMTMMALNLGKERNKMEWEKLLLAAGFSHYKFNPVLGVRSLIEVYP